MSRWRRLRRWTARPVAPAAGRNAEFASPGEIEHGEGLLRSHATTAGPPLPAEQVRAMTAVRLEQIAVGRSGLGAATAVRLEQIAVGRSGLGAATADALVDLLNTDRMPVIGRFNSLGTGDVAPPARLALTLPAGALDAGDGLALMSSNALTIGRGALAVIDWTGCSPPPR